MLSYFFLWIVRYIQKRQREISPVVLPPRISQVIFYISSLFLLSVASVKLHIGLDLFNSRVMKAIREADGD